jgi:hypothetical protein
LVWVLIGSFIIVISSHALIVTNEQNPDSGYQTSPINTSKQPENEHSRLIFQISDRNNRVILQDNTNSDPQSPENNLITSYGINLDASPTVVGPNNLQYEQGTIGHTLEWRISGTGPNKEYRISRDGSIVRDWTLWQQNNNYSISVDGLPLGIHNYTLTATVTGEVPTNDTAVVTVIDTTSPIYNALIGVYEYESGSINNQIYWDITEYNPKNYTIFKNGVPERIEPNWVNDGIIVQDIDGLVVGSYNYTIVAIDDLIQSSSNYINVTVYPSEKPQWEAIPSNFNYNETDPSVQIGWNVSDLFPSSYEIFHNNDLYDSGVWLSNENITITIGELLKGTHNFTIVVADLATSLCKL